MSYKILRPMQHTIDDIREAQASHKYIFISFLDSSSILQTFNFYEYQPGVYYISTNGDIYQVKNPGFLYANNLTLKSDEY